MLASDVHQLPSLFRRQAPPDVPGRQSNAERSGASRKEAGASHTSILAQCLLPVPALVAVTSAALALVAMAVVVGVALGNAVSVRSAG